MHVEGSCRAGAVVGARGPCQEYPVAAWYLAVVSGGLAIRQISERTNASTVQFAA